MIKKRVRLFILARVKLLMVKDEYSLYKNNSNIHLPKIEKTNIYYKSLYLKLKLILLISLKV